MPSEKGCKRAGKSEGTARLSLLWSVCTSSRGGQADHQGGPFLREEADTGGVTYGSPHAQVCGRRGRSDWCSAGSGLRGGHVASPRATHMRATSTCASRGPSLKLVGKSCGVRSKVLSPMHAPHGGVLTTPRQLFPPLLSALVRVTTCTVHPQYRVCRSRVRWRKRHRNFALSCTPRRCVPTMTRPQ